jgi:hypothetical protein
MNEHEWPTATDGYLIERVRYPTWLTDRDDEDLDDLRLVTGENPRWGAAIPLMYRLLAAPRAHLQFPEVPPASGPVGAEAAVYWTPLFNLLVTSFGWSRPDFGTQWWIEAGRPTYDHRLRLIADLWGADGQLDEFLEWLWTTSLLPLESSAYDLLGHVPRDHHADVDAWIVCNEVISNARGSIANGDKDPLHLTRHVSAMEVHNEHGTATMTYALGEPRATLLLDSMSGWYQALAEHGAELPEIGDNSWYVDVVVKPVGHLGTFRRSRQSGLWFSGPHHLHVLGL